MCIWEYTNNVACVCDILKKGHEQCRMCVIFRKRGHEQCKACVVILKVFSFKFDGCP